MDKNNASDSQEIYVDRTRLLSRENRRTSEGNKPTRADLASDLLESFSKVSRCFLAISSSFSRGSMVENEGQIPSDPSKSRNDVFVENLVRSEDRRKFAKARTARIGK